MKKSKRPFPLRFTLKGAAWRVKFRKNLADEGETCSGLTDTNARLILLDASLSEKDVVWVFWHEYAHAVLHESGVTGNTGGIEAIVEEIICDNIADAMVRDKVVTWKRIKKPKT